MTKEEQRIIDEYIEALVELREHYNNGDMSTAEFDRISQRLRDEWYKTYEEDQK